MARQDNIVDFNEARAASSARRAQSYADEWTRNLEKKPNRKRSRSTSRDSFSSLLDAPQSTSTEHRAYRSFPSSRDRADSGRNRASVRTNTLVDSYNSRQSRPSSARGYATAAAFQEEPATQRRRHEPPTSYGRGSRPDANRARGTMPSWLTDAYSDLDAARGNDLGGDATASPTRASYRNRTTGRERTVYSFDEGNVSTPFGSDRDSSFERDARNGERAATSRGPRAAVFDEQSLREEEGAEGDPPAKGLAARLKSLKRNATKNRADRKFDRQFGGSDAAPSGDAGPRAALYKGEMGQQQRYANRLQRNQSTSSGRSRGFSTSDRPGGFGQESPGSYAAASAEHAPRATRMSHPVLKIGAAAIAIIICGALFMFPSLQSYYQTMREHDRIEAEYQAVEQRNTALAESIDDLSSDDGIAAYAHDQFGLVKSGEQAVVVQGLETTRDGLDNVNASVQLDTIQAPETWYSPVLDKVFGFEN